MKKYFFANWKMYLNFDESVALAREFEKTFSTLEEDKIITVFPSNLSLKAVQEIFKDSQISVGPQNFYWVEKGGYTGEVSAQMHKEIGCTYALVGHSERRHIFKETNDDVKEKITAALAVGLVPVLCVGENKDERAQELQDEVVKKQLDVLLNQNYSGKIFIAYEPVWAIGTGDNCSSVSAEHMAEKIKNWTKEILGEIEVVVLYGGSVRAENISDYLKERNIDGVLVGGASTKIEDWKQIVLSK